MESTHDQNPLTILVIVKSRPLYDTIVQVFNRNLQNCQIIHAPSLQQIKYGFSADPHLVIADPFIETDDRQPVLRSLLKSHSGTLPLVVLIPMDTNEYRDAAIELNANGIVVAGEIATELLPVIEKVMARSSLQNRVADQIRWWAETGSPAGEAAYGGRLDNVGVRSSGVVRRLSRKERNLCEEEYRDECEGLSSQPMLQGLKYTAASADLNQKQEIWRTACNLNCGAHFCGMQLTVRNGQAVKVEPADFPDRRYRRICLKGISQLQLAMHSGRVLHPLKRTGERNEGKWQQVSWEQALDEIAGRMDALSRKYGPESMMFMSGSGQLSVVNGFAGAYLRLASVLGASGSSLAEFGLDSAIPSGIEMTFGAGSGYLANDYADLSNSRTVLIWGGDPAQSLMNWWPFFLEAKKGGTRLVAIDPKFSLTASKCDEWLPIRPGSDLYLALGMIHLIFENGWLDEDFIRKYTVGPLLVREDNRQFLRSRSGELQGYDVDRGTVTDLVNIQRVALFGKYTASGVICRPGLELLREMTAPYTQEMVSEKTGLTPEQIYHLAKLLATEKPARIFCHYGIDRWNHGAVFGRLVATLSALSGNLGHPGAGAGVGGLPEAGFLQSSFATPDGKTWHALSPAVLPGAISHGDPYRVRGVWAGFSNWLNQWPDYRNMCEEVVPNLELFVVSDLFMTETARWADYMLPVAHLFERADIVMGPGPYVQYQPEILAPSGESRSDYQIAGEIAKRLGCGEYFSQPVEYHLARILAEEPRTHGITFEVLKNKGVVRRETSEAAKIAHSQMTFETPTGRIEFYSERGLLSGKALPTFEPPAEADLCGDLAQRYPLICISKTSRYRVHSTFVNAPWLREIEPEPYIMIHPEDAGQRDIREGDLVRVFNDRGFVVLQARIRFSVPPGAVYLPDGWQTTDFKAGHSQSLTHGAGKSDNLFGPNSSYSDVLVEVEKYFAAKADQAQGQKQVVSHG